MKEVRKGGGDRRSARMGRMARTTLNVRERTHIFLLLFCVRLFWAYFSKVSFFFFFLGRQSLQTFPKPLLQFLVSSRNEGKNRAP